jgi:hypothetical protein
MFFSPQLWVKLAKYYGNVSLNTISFLRQQMMLYKMKNGCPWSWLEQIKDEAVQLDRK